MLGHLLKRSQAYAALAWFIFGVGIVILVAWIGLSAALVYDQHHNYGRPLGELWVMPLVMGVMFLPLGLVFAVKGYRGRVHRVDLHENGVAFQDGSGRTTMRWDELQSVFYEEFAIKTTVALVLDVTTRRTAKLTMLAPNRKPIVVDENVPDHFALANTIRAMATAAMLPRFDAAIAAGQRVYFGPIGIDRQGLHLTHVTYPWHVIAQVYFETTLTGASWVIFGANGARLNAIDTRSVPNEGVFQLVLERFGRHVPIPRAA